MRQRPRRRDRGGTGRVGAFAARHTFAARHSESFAAPGKLAHTSFPDAKISISPAVTGAENHARSTQSPRTGPEAAPKMHGPVRAQGPGTSPARRRARCRAMDEVFGSSGPEQWAAATEAVYARVRHAVVGPVPSKLLSGHVFWIASDRGPQLGTAWRTKPFAIEE